MLTKVQPLLSADQAYVLRVYLGEYLGDSGGCTEVGGIYEGRRVNQVEDLRRDVWMILFHIDNYFSR